MAQWQWCNNWQLNLTNSSIVEECRQDMINDIVEECPQDMINDIVEECPQDMINDRAINSILIH